MKIRGLCHRNTLIRTLVSIKYELRTADYGLGIKRRLSMKCGQSLKIAVLTHNSQKNLLFQFSPVLLSFQGPNLASPAVCVER